MTGPRGPALRGLCAAAAGCSFVVGVGAADLTAPATPVQPVSDVYHGVTVVDPYRWMEDMAAPPFRDWLKEQDRHARSVLATIPGRDALRKHIAELAEATTSVSEVERVRGRLFFLKSEPGHDQPRLFVRDEATGAERLLLDPLAVPGEPGRFSIDFLTPSPDGRFVAIGLSQGGAEQRVLRVLRVRDRRLMGERIERSALNEGVSWLADARAFFYNRQPAPDAAGQVERYTKSAVYLHRLGAPSERDEPVFGWGVNPSRSFEVADLPYVFTRTGSPWLLAAVLHGDAAERSFFVVRRSALHGAATPWRRIVGPADGVVQAYLADRSVYAISHKNASGRELWRLDPARPLAAPQVVLGGAPIVLRTARVSRRAVYVEGLDGGVGRLLRVPLGGGPATTVALPFEGSLQELAASERDDRLLLKLEGWSAPARWLASSAGAAPAALNLQPLPALDASWVESRRVLVKSHDGAMVPLSILAKKGLALEGDNPTILTGYGAYGISLEPRFSALRLAWLERGGVIAVAHVRGGGEFGEDWHRAGWILTKQNTVSDFIACAEYLIAERYTRPARLAGTGGSAGGITIGGAITQRPELFAAAQSAVGVSDMLRMELTPNGAPNIAEFGTVAKAEQFRAMFDLSPYHRVKDGTAYPGVIVTTGANDPRVDAWMPAKMAARLQAATSSAKPVLLRVDFEGGHGIGSGRAQWVDETADVWSFFLWQFGEPGFQAAQGPVR
ncbi:MAG TPA: prolyl oligopeptidase family serine peptidase [Caldimonas sp.]